MRKKVPITQKKELDFVVFCIENVALELGCSGEIIHRLFMQADLLNGYIVPCYEVLHTQGKEYIVEELITLMKRRGVLS